MNQAMCQSVLSPLGATSVSGPSSHSTHATLAGGPCTPGPGKTVAQEKAYRATQKTPFVIFSCPAHPSPYLQYKAILPSFSVLPETPKV